jgi:uncharacterized protein YutE (UPF0331/DUF86 family)
MSQQDIIAKLDYLISLLAELEATKPATLDGYLANSMSRRNAERLTQLIVECAGDICSLIVTERIDVPSPDTLYETFIQAAEVGALPRPFARQLAEWAKTRNVLVHQYNHIDDAKMFQDLQPILEQFSLFVKHIKDFLDGQQAASDSA